MLQGDGEPVSAFALDLLTLAESHPPLAATGSTRLAFALKLTTPRLSSFQTIDPWRSTVTGLDPLDDDDEMFAGRFVIDLENDDGLRCPFLRGG